MTWFIGIYRTSPAKCCALETFAPVRLAQSREAARLADDESAQLQDRLTQRAEKSAGQVPQVSVP
jgi:hypothetical protein